MIPDGQRPDILKEVQVHAGGSFALVNAMGIKKFEQAVALFKAEDRLITSEQTEKLNAR